MKKLSKQGFSMIELLVVLLIIGILAAIAAPFFLQNADKTRASEAVAGAGSIRNAERNYYAQNNSAYIPVADGTAYFESSGAEANVLGVTFQNMKYFSSASYTVANPGTFSTNSAGLTAQGFVITVNGANSVSLATDTTNGAANSGDVNNIVVEMDASGQTIWSSAGTGGPFNKY